MSPCLFNLYAEYILRNSGLEETQAGIKTVGRNINNRYADDTTLMAESEEELKSLLVKVKSLSRVQLLATPWTTAHQAPPSMGFSRQHCIHFKRKLQTLMNTDAKIEANQIQQYIKRRIHYNQIGFTSGCRVGLTLEH